MRWFESSSIIRDLTNWARTDYIFVNEAANLSAILELVSIDSHRIMQLLIYSIKLEPKIKI